MAEEYQQPHGGPSIASTPVVNVFPFRTHQRKPSIASTPVAEVYQQKLVEPLERSDPAAQSNGEPSIASTLIGNVNAVQGEPNMRKVKPSISTAKSTTKSNSSRRKKLTKSGKTLVESSNILTKWLLKHGKQEASSNNNTTNSLCKDSLSKQVVRNDGVYHIDSSRKESALSEQEASSSSSSSACNSLSNDRSSKQAARNVVYCSASSSKVSASCDITASSVGRYGDKELDKMKTEPSCYNERIIAHNCDKSNLMHCMLNCVHNLNLDSYCYRRKMAESDCGAGKSADCTNRGSNDQDDTDNKETTAVADTDYQYSCGSRETEVVGENMPGEIISDSEGEVLYVGENERDGRATKPKSCKTSTPLNKPLKEAKKGRKKKIGKYVKKAAKDRLRKKLSEASGVSLSSTGSELDSRESTPNTGGAVEDVSVKTKSTLSSGQGFSSINSSFREDLVSFLETFDYNGSAGSRSNTSNENRQWDESSIPSIEDFLIGLTDNEKLYQNPFQLTDDVMREVSRRTEEAGSRAMNWSLRSFDRLGGKDTLISVWARMKSKNRVRGSKRSASSSDGCSPDEKKLKRSLGLSATRDDFDNNQLMKCLGVILRVGVRVNH